MYVSDPGRPSANGVQPGGRRASCPKPPSFLDLVSSPRHVPGSPHLSSGKSHLSVTLSLILTWTALLAEPAEVEGSSMPTNHGSSLPESSGEASGMPHPCPECACPPDGVSSSALCVCPLLSPGPQAAWHRLCWDPRSPPHATSRVQALFSAQKTPRPHDYFAYGDRVQIRTEQKVSLN